MDPFQAPKLNIEVSLYFQNLLVNLSPNPSSNSTRLELWLRQPLKLLILLLFFFFSSSSFLLHLPPLKYNLDTTQEAEIWYEGSTHKNKIIQVVLESWVGLVFGLVWLVWFFSSIQLSWMDIQIRHNSGSWNQPCRLNSQTQDIPWGFERFGWFSFLFGLVGLVFLSHITILGGNITQT